jgi:hypothetical protein
MKYSMSILQVQAELEAKPGKSNTTSKRSTENAPRRWMHIKRVHEIDIMTILELQVKHLMSKIQQLGSSWPRAAAGRQAAAKQASKMRTHNACSSSLAALFSSYIIHMEQFTA